MAFTLPGTYDLIVEKFNTANPALTWRNTWTMTCTTAPTFGAGIIGAIQAFERSLTWDDSTVGTFKLYNWSRGAQIYPAGLPVWENVYGVAGDAHGAWPYTITLPIDSLGGEVTLRLDRFAPGGKPSRLFIRSLPRETDVIAVSGGKWGLDPATPLTDAHLQSIVTGSAINLFFGGGTSGQQLTVVRFSKKHGVVNGVDPVSSIHLIGVTTNRQTRKNRR